jgi:Bacterial antitoxin of ParD toxin-antitoxin type II system and RHH
VPYLHREKSRPGTTRIAARSERSQNTFAAAAITCIGNARTGESYISKITPEKELEALRAALLAGESSGISTPFDFDAFIERKRQGGVERQASAPKSR